MAYPQQTTYGPVMVHGHESAGSWWAEAAEMPWWTAAAASYDALRTQVDEAVRVFGEQFPAVRGRHWVLLTGDAVGV
jgi:hypothetical protein